MRRYVRPFLRNELSFLSEVMVLLTRLLSLVVVRGWIELWLFEAGRLEEVFLGGDMLVERDVLEDVSGANRFTLMQSSMQSSAAGCDMA